MTLIVDLTSARVSEIDTQPYTEKYVGGAVSPPVSTGRWPIPVRSLSIPRIP